MSWKNLKNFLFPFSFLFFFFFVTKIKWKLLCSTFLCQCFFSPWVKTKRNFVTIQMKANEQYTCISRDTQLFFGSRLWVCMYRMESLKFERNSSVSSDILHGSKFPNSYWFEVVRNIWKSYMWTEELYTQLLRLRKESLKKIQACTGFVFMSHKAKKSTWL